MIIELVHKANPAIHSLDLSVQTSGMTVTVGAGNFVLEKQYYVLDDDYSYDAPVTDYRRTIFGFLAKNKASNDAELVVQDMVAGVEDMKFMSDAHDLITMHFWFDLPANTSTLDDVEIYVHRFVPREQGGES